MQAFLLFIVYTMLASATAAGLILEKFIDLLSSGQMEDTVKCASWGRPHPPAIHALPQH